MEKQNNKPEMSIDERAALIVKILEIEPDLQQELGNSYPFWAPEIRPYKLSEWVCEKIPIDPNNDTIVEIYSLLTMRSKEDIKKQMEEDLAVVDPEAATVIRENFPLDLFVHTVSMNKRFGKTFEKRVLSDRTGKATKMSGGKIVIDFEGTETWIAEQEYVDGVLVKSIVACRGPWMGLPADYYEYTFHECKQITGPKYNLTNSTDYSLK